MSKKLKTFSKIGIKKIKKMMEREKLTVMQTERQRERGREKEVEEVIQKDSSSRKRCREREVNSGGGNDTEG